MRSFVDLVYLLLDLTKRDLAARYVSSVAGVIWLVAYPAIICAVFVLFFNTIAGTRANAQEVLNPAIFIICGFTPFQFWSEVLNRSAGAVVAVPSLVKNVVFPLELVCGSIVLAGAVQLGVNLVLLAGIALIVFGVEPNVWMALAPLLLLPLLLMVLALSLFLAASGVFFRDLVQVVTLLTTASMFFGPVFFDAKTATEPMRSILHVNPLTQPINGLRSIFLHAEAPDLWSAAANMAVACVLLVAAFAYFRSVSRDFADVL